MLSTIKKRPKPKRYTQRRRVKTQPKVSYKSASQKLGRGNQFRAVLVLFILCGGLIFVGARLSSIALVPPLAPEVASLLAYPEEAVRRGNIYDRNGNLLAATLQVNSVYADPKYILSVNEVEQKLGPILPHVKWRRLHKRLKDKNRRFVWVERHITPKQAQAINTLGLPGIGFRHEYVRVYPQKELAAHVVGSVNTDNKGIAGIEIRYNTQLNAGEDVYVTIDVNLQELMRTALIDMQKRSASVAAWGVVLDPYNGDILTLVSLPDFDPHHYAAASESERMNRAVLGTYEMGSTFKLFTLAQGLKEGHVTPETLIDCTKPLKIGRFTINDYHAKRRVMTAMEVLRYSSNIGAAQIADMSGPEKQEAFYRSLGLLDRLDSGLPEIAQPRYPKNWGRVHTMTISYGHGMAVSPLQLLAASAALVTDGRVTEPHIIKGHAVERSAPLFENSTLADIRMLMKDVVRNGSGRNAAVKGFTIGGKTGTAEKAESGGYSKNKNIVSFIGALPADNPRYVALIMFDEPKHGFHTGGLAAAPVFKQFAEGAIPILGLRPDMQVIAAERVARQKKEHRRGRKKL